ncbi:hypothetical protein P280DRAFT_521633 [Massarina eburnea CBS 473.64]|uniref:Uncharacterized protein n=1 Tax=Massarina eburnea CBS 473.64 TaxID=1395130 RepID=A0A6A6RS84_9PLEO|nr:hypothetical protein P280DRAFT_521633 [Massarina eburnea CBS 473.64]
MSSPQTVCAPCQDSPLSMTGNFLGILTFFYVLIVGIWYRTSIIRQASWDLMNLDRESEYIVKRTQRLVNRGVFNQEVRQGELRDDTLVSWGALTRDLQKLEAMKNNMSTGKSKSWWDPMLGGIRYLRNRDLLADYVNRVNVWSGRLATLVDEAE